MIMHHDTCLCHVCFVFLECEITGLATTAEDKYFSSAVVASAIQNSCNNSLDSLRTGLQHLTASGGLHKGRHA
jgi:hypothetical protein